MFYLSINSRHLSCSKLILITVDLYNFHSTYGSWRLPVKECNKPEPSDNRTPVKLKRLLTEATLRITVRYSAVTSFIMYLH